MTRNSAKLLSFIVRNANGYIEESNENNSLMLVSVKQSRYLLKGKKGLEKNQRSYYINKYKLR